MSQGNEHTAQNINAFETEFQKNLANQQHNSQQQLNNNEASSSSAINLSTVNTELPREQEAKNQFTPADNQVKESKSQTESPENILEISAKDSHSQQMLSYTNPFPLGLVSPSVTPSLPTTPVPVVPTDSFINSTERDLLPDQLPVVKCVARARIPTTHGPEIFLHLYSNNVDNKEHLAIVFGENIRSKSLFQKVSNETQSDRMTRGAYIGKLFPGRTSADKCDLTNQELHFNEDGSLIYEPKTSVTEDSDPTLVRIHSECYTGETAWSARCDCGEQFDEAGRLMGEKGRGCIVYLRQEGRGIGLGEKLKAYNLQDLGADTVQANLMLRHPADARSFSLATAILLDLNLTSIDLLTNNPDKIIAVEGKNRVVKVKQRVPMVPLAWKHDPHGVKSKEIEGYLRTKIEKMGHLLQQPINI